MSCMKVDKETVAQIVTICFELVRRKEIETSPIHAIKEPRDPFHAKIDLALTLSSMNVDALNARYNNLENKMVSMDRFMSNDFEYSIPVTNREWMQFHKTVDFFLYQCMEGRVPETNMYKWVESVRDAVANMIVRRSDGYEDLDWG